MEAGMTFMHNPYYFLFACLVGDGDDDNTDSEELHLIDDGKTRFLTGTPVSSLYHLKDLDGVDAAFFVFPDLGVRKEGRYKFKMTLFEMVEGQVFYCSTLFTGPFTVYSAKKFPGMQRATDLSKSFADQGLKIRVRRDPRKRTVIPRTRPRRMSASEDDEDDEEPEEYRASKRSRHSYAPSDDMMMAPPPPPPQQQPPQQQLDHRSTASSSSRSAGYHEQSPTDSYRHQPLHSLRVETGAYRDEVQYQPQHQHQHPHQHHHHHQHRPQQQQDGSYYQPQQPPSRTPTPQQATTTYPSVTLQGMLPPPIPSYETVRRGGASYATHPATAAPATSSSLSSSSSSSPSHYQPVSSSRSSQPSPASLDSRGKLLMGRDTLWLRPHGPPGPEKSEGPAYTGVPMSVPPIAQRVANTPVATSASPTGGWQHQHQHQNQQLQPQDRLSRRDYAQDGYGRSPVTPATGHDHERREQRYTSHPHPQPQPQPQPLHQQHQHHHHQHRHHHQHQQQHQHQQHQQRQQQPQQQQQHTRSRSDYEYRPERDHRYEHDHRRDHPSSRSAAQSSSSAAQYDVAQPDEYHSSRVVLAHNHASRSQAMSHHRSASTAGTTPVARESTTYYDRRQPLSASAAISSSYPPYDAPMPTSSSSSSRQEYIDQRSGGGGGGARSPVVSRTAGSSVSSEYYYAGGGAASPGSRSSGTNSNRMGLGHLVD